MARIRSESRRPGMGETYEIRVRGLLGPALRAAFDGMRCEPVPGETTIRGPLTRAELHTLLDRLDRLGLPVTRLECGRPGRRPAVPAGSESSLAGGA